MYHTENDDKAKYLKGKYLYYKKIGGEIKLIKKDKEVINALINNQDQAEKLRTTLNIIHAEEYSFPQ